MERPRPTGALTRSVLRGVCCRWVIASSASSASRQPSENELGMVRFQGEHGARIAQRLAG